MQLDLSPAAAQPLIRALDKFANSLAAVAKSVSQGHGSEAKSIMDSFTSSLNSSSSNSGVSSIAKASVLAGSAMGKFSSIASKATSAMAKFNIVASAASAVIKAGKQVPGIEPIVNVGQAGFSMIFKRLTSDFAALNVPLVKFTQKADVLTIGLEEAGKASHAYSSAISSSATNIAATAEGFMKSFGEALSNPMAGLPALVGAVRPFVEAFNPYALQQFDDALRTVYAVIGEALVPIVKMAAGVLREFAGYLRPVMKQLQPVFAELAQMAGGFLKDLIPELARFAQELVPIFRAYLDQMKQSIHGQKEMMLAGLKYATGQIGLLDVIATGIKAWLAKLPFIGSWFKPSKEEQDKAAAERAAANAQVPKENIFSFGAPTNPQFKAAEMLGRDTLQAAYGAMPGFEQKNDQIGLLQDIEKNTREQVGLMGQMIAGLAKPISDTVRAASSVQEGAKVYDERVQGGGIIGGAQWAAGQTVEGVYNFGVGIGNLFTGKSWSEGMVDI